MSRLSIDDTADWRGRSNSSHSVRTYTRSYGVTSYAVTQRRHELGVRVALGAQRGHISGLLLRRARLLAGFGATAGVTIALGLTRLMSALLYGVSAVDPLTFTITTIFVGSTAMLATWIPARRAARADPMVALRTE